MSSWRREDGPGTFPIDNSEGMGFGAISLFSKRSLGLGMVIFGAGGPLTVEIEESCARLGLLLSALLLNREGSGYALDASRLRPALPLPSDLVGSLFLCPLFTPANRRIAVAEAEALGLMPAPALIDPTAIRAASAVFGVGCFINAGAIIGALAMLGRFVIVNRGASLGHHAVIGDFASIGPGVVMAGQVRVGAEAMIGAGAVVAPGVALGEGCRVAPGTVVSRDVPAGRLAHGNPMRIGG